MGRHYIPSPLPQFPGLLCLWSLRRMLPCLGYIPVHSRNLVRWCILASLRVLCIYFCIHNYTASSVWQHYLPISDLLIIWPPTSGTQYYNTWFPWSSSSRQHSILDPSGKVVYGRLAVIATSRTYGSLSSSYIRSHHSGNFIWTSQLLEITNLMTCSLTDKDPT